MRRSDAGETRSRLRSRFGLAWCLVLVALLNALGWTALRWRYEHQFGRVQMAVGLGDAQYVADACRTPRLRLLRALKSRGVGTITVSEQTLTLLRADGRIAITSRENAVRLFPSLEREFIQSRSNYLVWNRDDAILMNDIEAHLREALPLSQAPRAVVLPSGGHGLLVSGGAQMFNDASMGFDPAQLAQVRAAGLRPVATLSNRLGTDAKSIARRLDEVRQSGARLVIFDDTETLGYSTLLPFVARALDERGLSVCNFEFSRQLGATELAQESEGNLLRAHVVAPQEAAQLSPDVLAERYVRAGRERKVRLLWVRLLRHLARPSGSKTVRVDDALAQNLDYVASIRRGLGDAPRWAQSGSSRVLSLALRTGESAPFGDFPRDVLQKKFGKAASWIGYLGVFASGLGALGAWLLLAHLFCDLSRRQERAILGFGFLSVALLSALGTSGAKLLAFAVACAFPVVALAWSDWPRALRMMTPRHSAREVAPECVTHEYSCGAIMRAMLVVTARALGLALCGGLLVASLLGDWRFFSKTDDFWGTKAAQMVPLALAAWLACGGFSPQLVASEGAARRQSEARERVRRWLGRGFSLQMAALCFGVAFGLWLWLARSGNESGVSVSDFEWHLRAWLERGLMARPRNKEMLAYPALAVSLWCVARGFRAAGLCLGTLGVIGPIDALNSFAQANNPLALSLLRSFWGATIGALFGVLAVLVLECALKRPSPAQLKTQFSPRVRRVSAAVAVVAVLLWGVQQWRMARRYAWLSAPQPQATWPWPQARREELSRGVTHWIDRSSPDGTTLELIEFDFRRDSRLRFSIYDGDEDDDRPFDNRVAYWKRGLAPTARRIDGKTRGNLVALWNGAFFGLINRRPRERDQAFHLAPIVLRGQTHYVGANHRWTVGVRKSARGAAPRFDVVHLPSSAELSDFEYATGCAQCVLKDGRALRLRPYPHPNETPMPSPVASTPEEAGHIPTLDFMKTSRVSIGWSNDNSRLWLLFVKEPDGEDASRAAVARNRAAYGGWKLDDVQRFWLAMRDRMGARSAVVLDGGDVAQLAFRQRDTSRQTDDFELAPPRFSTRKGAATKRFVVPTSGDAAPPGAQVGGALMYFYVWRE